MKAFCYCFAFLFFSAPVKAQQTDPFNTGFEKLITSKVLGEPCKVWVHIPNNATGKEDYPVIYLLDGDANFNDIVSHYCPVDFL